MPIYLPEKCFRGLRECCPISAIESDDTNPETGMPLSFICMGKHNGSFAKPDRKQDEYTVCWHNDQIDTRDCWDRRDIVDTISVFAQGLSALENIALN